MTVNLLQGDCLELIKDIPDGSVDCIITDPPYGSTEAKWDIVPDLKIFFSEAFRVLKKNGVLACFCQLPFGVDLINNCRKNFRYEIIWKKSKACGFLNANKMPLRSHENILIFYRELPVYNPQKTKGSPYINKVNVKRSSVLFGRQTRWQTINPGNRYPLDVLEFKSERKEKYHPTQKPVDLIAWLVKSYTNPGDTVLDCFMGSGTTGVACVRNNRNFIGIELQEKYFEIAKNRIEDEIKKAENHAECKPFWNLSTGETNVGGINFTKESVCQQK